MGHYKCCNRAIITRETWDALDVDIKDRYVADLERFNWTKEVGEKIGMNAAEAASAGKICWYAYNLEIVHYNIGCLNVALGTTKRLRVTDDGQVI